MTRTLIVTVESDQEFHEEVSAGIAALEDGETLDRNHIVSFPSEELLAETFTSATLTLLRAIAEREPGSIRETARVVERDVKNVHRDLTRLEKLGIVRFQEDGQAKRPVFPFDELVIEVAFDRPTDGTPDGTKASH